VRCHRRDSWRAILRCWRPSSALTFGSSEEIVVSQREDRSALCWGLLQLIQQDRLRYGYWRSTSGMRLAFALVQNSEDMNYVIEATWPDPAAGGLLMALVKGLVAVETGYRRGQPDLVFIPLTRWRQPMKSKSAAPSFVSICLLYKIAA
jgi:hypothetical protein